MTKKITKKRMIEIINYLSERLEFWIKLIRKYDKRLSNPPLKYKIVEITFKKKSGKIWEASYITEDDHSMRISGDFFYCISMLNAVNQMGFYIEDDKKKTKIKGK